MRAAGHGGNSEIQNLRQQKSAGHGEQNPLPAGAVFQGRQLHLQRLRVPTEKVHQEVLSCGAALFERLGRLQPAHSELEQFQHFRVQATDAQQWPGEKDRQGRIRFFAGLPKMRPRQLHAGV